METDLEINASDVAPAMPEEQIKKKGKGLKIASIVFFVLGILFSWIPVVGIILCVVSLILNIAAAAKKVSKKRTGAIIRTVISVILIISALISTAFIGILIFADTESTVATTVVKDSLARKIGRYNLYGNPTLKATKVSDGIYDVTGKMTVSQLSVKENREYIYNVDVDCTVDTTTKSITRNASKLDKEPVKHVKLEKAIDRIDKKKAKEAFMDMLKADMALSYGDPMMTSSVNLSVPEPTYAAEYIDELGTIRIYMKANVKTKNKSGEKYSGTYIAELITYDLNKYEVEKGYFTK
ncbi:MAG: hypothetical protein II155_07945 [Clostridia bacterium]|nr:hypothetical protein [Clostridia bacterium]